MHSSMDMFVGRDIAADSKRVLDVVADGGVAIFPTVVGYGIVGHEDEAIAQIFRAKQRSVENVDDYLKTKST